eukprot:gene29731-38872_t
MPLPELFSAANPVFAGGFGLAVLASGAQILRMSANIGLQYVKRHLLVSMEVTSKDRSYSWHISVETSITGNRTSGSGGGSTHDSNVKVDFLPSPGQHILFYGGKYLMPWEKIQLTALGRSTDIFQKILADAVLMALNEERLVFMTTNFIDRLDPALIRPGRIMNLYKTFFPEEISEKADEFLVSIRAAYPVISMAALQGHLLMHKNSPATAIQSLSGFQKKSDVTIRSTDSDNDTVPDQVPLPAVRKVGGRRVLTREQVDQMYFNPQPGWDKDIVQIK